MDVKKAIEITKELLSGCKATRNHNGVIQTSVDKRVESSIQEAGLMVTDYSKSFAHEALDLILEALEYVPEDATECTVDLAIADVIAESNTSPYDMELIKWLASDAANLTFVKEATNLTPVSVTAHQYGSQLLHTTQYLCKQHIGMSLWSDIKKAIEDE